MTQTEMLFNLQIGLTLVVGSLIVSWYILPKLQSMPLQAALVPPLLMAAFRFHGLNFLVPELQTLPPEFSSVTAPGDFTVSMIALVGAILLRNRRAVGVYFAWAYLLLGSADLINGFYLGDKVKMALHLGIAWFMALVEAPLQILCLYVIGRLLLSGKKATA